MSDNNLRYCTNCGNAVSADKPFCTRCGHRIEGQDTPVNTTSAYATPAASAAPGTPGQSVKKGVNKIALVIGVVCVLCAVVLFAIMFLPTQPTIYDTPTANTPAAETAKETVKETAQSAEESTPAGAPSQEASAADSSAASAADSAAASAPVATSTPAAAPVFPAYSASSSLAPDAYTSYYGPLNAIDNDMLTAWVEGADGFGAGEWVRIGADSPQTVKGIKVLGGYTKSEDLYYRNNRPQLVTITLSDGYTRQFELGDDFGKWQSIDFDGPHQSTYVQLTIESVYGGRTWDDTCISEISAY